MDQFSLNSIGSLLSGGGLSAISKRTKIRKEDVAKVLSAGIPALVGGMRRNAAAEEGAKSLTRALSDHSKADISDPASFLKTSDLKDGKKILGHVLGGDQDRLAEEISRSTGVTKAKTGTILALVAPLLLSLLGSQNNSQSSSSGGLLGMLGGLLGGGQSSSGGLMGGLLGSLLGGGSASQASTSNTIQIVEQQPAQQEQSSSGGFLDGILSLLH